MEGKGDHNICIYLEIAHYFRPAFRCSQFWQNGFVYCPWQAAKPALKLV